METDKINWKDDPKYFSKKVKEYRQRYKGVKLVCEECGLEYQRGRKWDHKRTKKHNSNLII